MRDRPCPLHTPQPTCHLGLSRVSFLHRAPRPSHPLTRKSPIKSQPPRTLQLEARSPLEYFDTGRGDRSSEQESADILFQSGLEGGKLLGLNLSCARLTSITAS